MTQRLWTVQLLWIEIRASLTGTDMDFPAMHRTPNDKPYTCSAVHAGLLQIPFLPETDFSIHIVIITFTHLKNVVLLFLIRLICDVLQAIR